MKISDEGVIINQESVTWSEVSSLRLLNQKLSVKLKNGNVREFEISHVLPTQIDQLFRAFEVYLRSNPTSKKQS